MTPTDSATPVAATAALKETVDIARAPVSRSHLHPANIISAVFSGPLLLLLYNVQKCSPLKN